MMPILYDETGKIEDVFVHEPDLECRIALEAEDPSMWLFDSALKGVDSLEWIKQAKLEHLRYVQLLQEQGVNVHYLTDLLKQHEVMLRMKLEEALKSAVAQKLIATESAENFSKKMQMSLVNAALCGVTMKYEDYHKLEEAGLSILIPKPNAYFVQDPFAIIGDLFVKLKPATWQRSGEPELWDIALHPENFYQMHHISEGGDITVVKNKVFVGIGTRTEPHTAFELYWLYKNKRFHYIDDVIVVFKPDAGKDLGLNHSQDLPYIHIDTIWMPICYLKNVGNVPLMTRSVAWNKGQLYTLEDYVIKCKKKIVPTSEKEQYSLAPNVLPANGVVISADVNAETNGAMVNAGLDVKPFAAKTLLGGSGSGHCMSNTANYVLIN